jgi:tRNA pseudouridine synthase 10
MDSEISGGGSEEDVAEVDCFICQGLMLEIPSFAELAITEMDKYEYDNFQVGVKVDPEISQREEQIWGEINATHQELIKAELNREIGKLVQKKTKKEVEFSKPQLVTIIDTSFDHVDLQVSPIFIYGRYRKFQRGIPQTKWPCRKCRGAGCESCGQTGKQYEETVEELISERVLELTGGDRAKFHGMGREDIDARMLGNGRPFVLEISKPIKRNLDLAELEEEINRTRQGKIAISGLEWVPRDKVKWIKAATFPKTYCAKVKFSKRVSPDELKIACSKLDGVTLDQRTPQRVSHRRADLVRRRKIIHIRIDEWDEEEGLWALISIKGESGLYIKELLHSDEGRTTPSLKGLLAENSPVEVSIEYLDVTEVCDESPTD